MALISSTETPVFDATAIQQRDLIRARYHTWPEARNAIVVSVDGDTLQAIFLPGVHAATCYYTIKAQEVADGKWDVLYSRDLATVEHVEMSDTYKAREVAKDGGDE